MVEAERNRLLRLADWRFLVSQPDRPWALDRASGRMSQAARLVTSPAADGFAADLVVLAHPTRARVAGAREALRPGGHIYCEWRFPRPGGIKLAASQLEQAGFTDVRLLWPWPFPPLGLPGMWLPVESLAAAQALVSLRPPPASYWGTMARALWPVAAHAGLLTPVCAVARKPSSSEVASDDHFEALADPRGGGRTAAQSSSWALLTGGRRSIGKVVALPFSRAVPRPELVVKFARVPEADAALEREAAVLSELAMRHPPIRGVPRVLAVGRRVGRIAVAESAIHGVPMAAQLNAASFGELARLVTGWLADLAGPGSPVTRADWEQRLVNVALEDFRIRFAGAVDDAMVDAMRVRLKSLRSLPLCFEHRDCAPWNVTLKADGRPALLDWESAEPHGLPGMDLTYFLANAAFLVEGSFESGRTRETYARLLDPTTVIGSVAAECFTRYCERVGINVQSCAALRLLCWLVHARSEHARMSADAAGAPGLRTLRESIFLGLIYEELPRTG